MKLVEYLPSAVFVNLGLLAVKLNPADGSILAWAITSYLKFDTIPATINSTPHIIGTSMKYKLGFVQEVKNFRHDFLYIGELEALCKKYGMEADYMNKLAPLNINRWSPQEIFKALENE